MIWTASSIAWLLIGEASGLLVGGMVGFVIGVRVHREHWREAMMMAMAVMIVGAWVASVVCSMAISYVIPVGVHSIAGVVVGSLFGKDALRKLSQNGGGS